MENNTLFIYVKNMCCARCIKAVSGILERLDIRARQVELGVIELEAPLEHDRREALRQALEAEGFELILDRRTQLFEQIRTAVIEFVNGGHSNMPNLSDFVSRKCLKDYSALSKLFSEMKGVSIEKYYIALRIERVKELLVYDNLTVTEIAWQLGYSSVAHLSAQFRTVTGLSPSQFKALKEGKRKAWDEV